MLGCSAICSRFSAMPGGVPPHLCRHIHSITWPPSPAAASGSQRARTNTTATTVEQNEMLALIGFSLQRFYFFKRRFRTVSYFALSLSLSLSGFGVMSSQPYELTHQDVLNCRFDQWHPLFSSRTFASQVIPLPEEFLAYLQADGIDASGSAFPEAPSQLRGWSAPRPEKSVADFARECGFAIQSLSSSGSDDGENIETQVEATRARKAKGKESGAAFYSLDSFKALDAKIRDALDQLDGEAFPKLSWSAPLDAVWIGEQQSLKCTEPQHVYLLLKASDRVSHDLTSAYDHCPAQPPAGLCGQLLAQQFLVLRRWFRLDHGMEFRCFVRNGSLVAVSQRSEE